MKITSTIFIFFCIFFVYAGNRLEKYAPDRHVSFAEQGRQVDNFLSRTFKRLSNAYDAIWYNYNRCKKVAKEEAERKVRKAAEQAKNAASSAVESGISSAKEKVFKR